MPAVDRLLPRLASAVVVALAVACGAEAPEQAGSSSASIVGGLGNVTVTTAGTIVNRYTALAADAAAGVTSITVANGAALNATKGDLLFVIQMQGATIDSTDTRTFGAVSNLDGAGLYEMVTLDGINGNTVTLSAGCGLKNAYSAAAHTQVVWVPQYQTLTVNAPGSIVAPAWNGATGGIVVIQAGTANLNAAGSIDVSAVGFRGGALTNFAYAPPTATYHFRSTDVNWGAEKGEGVAGYEADYDNSYNGRYSIGAAANAGGGGAAHNGGGGGGANGDDGQTWSGAGVMPGNVTGAAAWALDPDDIANGNQRTTSSGGGRGGYSYSNQARNPLTTAPGNALWGGDNRNYRGGLGGRPMTSDPAKQIFFGGGGGAGNENNGSGGAGGRGGGIAYVVADTIDGAGTGSIRANGENGHDTPNGANQGNDGPGGGGGGGTVVLMSTTVTSLAVSANGGAGGNQYINGFGNEAEGAGAGGGGGYVAVAAGVTVATPAGGAGGTTNSPAMTGFPRDGATDGGAGQLATIAKPGSPPMCIAADLGVTMTDGITTATPGTNVTYTITVTNNGPNPATGATVTDTFPAACTSVAWTCAGSACPAASGTGNISAVLGALAPGASVTFSAVCAVASSATGTLTNTVTVAPPANVVDGVSGNNTVTLSNPLVPSADAAVTLSHAPPQVVVNSTYTYSLGVNNGGPSDGTGLDAKLVLPAGSTYQSATGAGWSCTQSAGTVDCTAATLAASASASITVTLTAPSTVGPATATATVTAATSDPNLANNSVTDSTNLLCGVDSDCQTTEWCNAGTCTAKLPNGDPLPNVPPINGKCTQQNGARVCLSGVCDTADDKCGYANGDGPCTGANGQMVCRSKICATTGPNAGKCEPCNTDGDCAMPTPACDSSKSACVQCDTANTSQCSGKTPICDTTTDTCVPCNGDFGDNTTHPCGTAGNPWCDTTGANAGACAKCQTNADCKGHTGGPICDTKNGDCVGCLVDSDCPSGDFCDKQRCKPKLPDGQPCDRPEQCVSAQCTNGTCGNGTLGDGGRGNGNGDDGGAGSGDDGGGNGATAGIMEGGGCACTTGSESQRGDAGIVGAMIAVVAASARRRKR